MEQIKQTDFYLDKYLDGILVYEDDEDYISVSKFNVTGENDKLKRFESICKEVKKYIDNHFSQLKTTDKDRMTDLQRDAILGKPLAVKKVTEQIKDVLTSLNLLSEPFPSYYRSLDSAVFAELFGISGITPWANDYTSELRSSAAAKLIGDKFYCMINGVSTLQPQRIGTQRREQLRRALLLTDPNQRIGTGKAEVYLDREDGQHIRVTILSGDYTRPDQDIIVFRKYLLSDNDELTFENLASYNTFPSECIPMFKSMVKWGPNIMWQGMVRSGKTTFLNTWQHYEDASLEGTVVSSDTETDFSSITNGPLCQIIADDENLDNVEKSLKRLDSNYIIFPEVRSAAQYKLYLGITDMGTRRCKCTIHATSAITAMSKMANEIVSEYGGNREAITAQLFNNTDYIFELFEVPSDRSKKRLRKIVEMRYDERNDLCSCHTICEYDSVTDSWKWKADVDKKHIAMGYEKEYDNFVSILKKLEDENPLTGETVVYPSYYPGNSKMNDILR